MTQDCCGRCAAPAGYVLVPREPTPEMVSAAITAYVHAVPLRGADGASARAIKAAIAAAPAAPAPGTDLPRVVLTAPERIRLQVSDDPDDAHTDWPAGNEVTWCRDSAVACEVEYVRADLAAAPAAPAEPVAAQSWDHLKLMMQHSAWDGRLELDDALKNIDDFARGAAAPVNARLLQALKGWVWARENRASEELAEEYARAAIAAAEAQPKVAPLTDDQLWASWLCMPAVAEGEDDSMEARVVRFARAIERAHGITAAGEKGDTK